MGLGHGTQQTQGHQLQHRFFSRRKGRKVCILEISGRDYRVVVSYFLIVDDRMGVCLLYTSVGNQIVSVLDIGHGIVHLVCSFLGWLRALHFGR